MQTGAQTSTVSCDGQGLVPTFSFVPHIRPRIGAARVRRAGDPLGAGASSDVLRQRARCTACGHKGAILQRPSWADAVVGFMPFPVERDSSL